MLLIPAIDLKDGKCVRLRQGRMEDSTVFSDDPVAMAERWVEAGARRLHLVDLNGAFAGQPVNAQVIRRIAQTFPDLPIQVGGGIRDEQTVETYLDAGVQFVIIGTKAVQDPHFISDLCLEYPGHIIERYGVEAIVYTDISRDGMMQGVNVEATVRLAQAITIPVIASGGVSTLDDVRALCAVEQEGIMGAIIGRALYDGAIDLAEAQRLADPATEND
jgi:phosphoribosylformimino-5-aminoimidazole carboxamide ribotide isomerase